MNRRRVVTLVPVLAALACMAMAPGVFAQQYPTKPVRMIVPFPPGGTTDVVARLLGAKVGEKWGQTIVVDNVAGASGMIGTQAGVRAAPDGYVMTLGNNQTHATNASLFSKLTFDMIKDVQPVAVGWAQRGELVAERHHVEVAVVGALEAQHQVAARVGARHADRVQRRLGARHDELHRVDRRHRGHDALG